MKEQRTFKPDENVIFHLIKSQNSTPLSALKELIQNSFDADATECDIIINEIGFEIKDNGKGFANKDDIVNNFERFGKPHEEDLLQKFGRFRMGRCQVFAYSKTKWVSNNYFLDVDIINNGLTYNLEEKQSFIDGCTIIGTWYESAFFIKDTFTSLDEFIQHLSYHVLYIKNMKISINGKIVNHYSYKTLQFAFENDNFYFLKRDENEPLSVFNIGMFVCNIPSYLNGIIISKKHLKLDISRKHLVYDDPLFLDIKATLKQHFPYLKNKRKKLTKNDILNLYTDVYNGEFDFHKSYENADLKIFLSTNRVNSYSLKDLTLNKFILADEHDFKVDKISQSGFLTIDTSLIRNAYVNIFQAVFPIEKLFKRLILLMDYKKDEIFNNFIDSAIAYESVKSNESTIKDTDLSSEEIALLKALRTAHLKITNALLQPLKYSGLGGEHNFSKEYILNLKGRRLVVGKSSNNTYAYTDGSTFIAFSQNFFNNLKKGDGGILKVVLTILHEYCHLTPDNLHDAEFYQDYHTLTCTLENLPHIYCQTIKKNIIKNFNKDGLKIPDIFSLETILAETRSKKNSLKKKCEDLNYKITSLIYDIFETNSPDALKSTQKLFPENFEDARKYINNRNKYLID